MKLRAECIPCLQRQTVQALRFISADESVVKEALREVMRFLLSVDWNVTPPELDYGVQRIIRKFAGGDPYAEVKRKSNDHAMSLLSCCREIIEKSKDPLKAAVKMAIAGNIMDFGALSSYDLEETLDMVLRSELTVDHYDLLRRRLDEASSLLYFADNAGEIAFDKLLLEVLLERRNLEVTFVVKGGPMINDATMEDVRHVGLDELPGVSFRTVSNGEPGTGPKRNSEEVLGWIREHDLVISKGQGNYESLSEFRGIFYLLMVKCPVVANSLGLRMGDIVLMYR